MRKSPILNQDIPEDGDTGYGDNALTDSYNPATGKGLIEGIEYGIDRVIDTTTDKDLRTAPLKVQPTLNEGATGSGFVQVLDGESSTIKSIQSSDGSINFFSGGNYVDAKVKNALPTIQTDDELKKVSVNIAGDDYELIPDENYVRFYNNTGNTLVAGAFIHLKSASGTVPVFELAVANESFEKVQGTIMCVVSEVANNSYGIATKGIRNINCNTSHLDLDTYGAQLWVSPTEDYTKPNITNIKPEFPNYAISVGGAYNSQVDGTIIVSITSDESDTYHHISDGSFRESINFTVSSNGSTITGLLENKDNTKNLTMLFSDVEFATLDTTTTPLTIQLTAGTNGNPQLNYVYIPKSTKVLTVSTSDWPAEEHIKVADVYVESAARVQTLDILANRNWNDHIKAENGNGHLLHISERMRLEHAKHFSGTEGTCTVTGGNVVDISVTGGIVYQLHRQIFPAFNTATGSYVRVVNDETEPYLPLQDIENITTDAKGDTLNNTSYSLVLLGVQNKTGEPCNLLINKPSGTYSKNTPDNAVNDPLNYSVYNIDNAMTGKAFLIARFTFVNSNGVITLYDTEDLRKKIPNNSAGGGAGGNGVTDWLALTDTPNSYAGYAGYVPKVNQAESALEFFDIGSEFLPLTAGSGKTLTNTLYGTSINMSGGGTFGSNLSVSGTATAKYGKLTGVSGSTGHTETLLDIGTSANVFSATSILKIAGFLGDVGAGYIKAVRPSSGTANQNNMVLGTNGVDLIELTRTGSVNILSNMSVTGSVTATSVSTQTISSTSGAVTANSNVNINGFLKSQKNLDSADLISLMSSGTFGIGWNYSTGGGASTLINSWNGGSRGGFDFYSIDNTDTITQLMKINSADGLIVNTGASFSDTVSGSDAVNDDDFVTLGQLESDPTLKYQDIANSITNSFSYVKVAEVSISMADLISDLSLTTNDHKYAVFTIDYEVSYIYDNNNHTIRASTSFGALLQNDGNDNITIIQTSNQRKLVFGSVSYLFCMGAITNVQTTSGGAKATNTINVPNYNTGADSVLTFDVRVIGNATGGQFETLTAPLSYKINRIHKTSSMSVNYTPTGTNNTTYQLAYS